MLPIDSLREGVVDPRCIKPNLGSPGLDFAPRTQDEQPPDTCICPCRTCRGRTLPEPLSQREPWIDQPQSNRL
eukprot:7182985-Pyramimonas_sp.AAC.1